MASTQTVTHEYLTQSGKVMRETVKTDGTVTLVLDFIYDESGKPFAMIDQLSAQPKTYYYVLNLQGDVVKLIDQDGAVAAAYAYDAWGNILSQSGGMASVNPLRYRGYYYDSETGFYYLQSRYYDPANHRFINADVYSSTDSSDAVSCNMFAYCNNNPVIASDENGDFFFTIIGAVSGAISGAINAAVNGDNILSGALIGAGTGAVAGAAVDFAVATGGIGGVAIAAIGGAAASGGGSILNDVANGREIDFVSAGIDAVIGAGTNLLSFGMVDRSALSSGGNILKNCIKNGGKLLMENTTRKVAGRIAMKSTAGVVKNVAKNISSNMASNVATSFFANLIGKPFKEVVK